MKDITYAIYDTLMGNTRHEQLYRRDITCQEVDNTRGLISFEYRGYRVDIAVSGSKSTSTQAPVRILDSEDHED